LFSGKQDAERRADHQSSRAPSFKYGWACDVWNQASTEQVRDQGRLVGSGLAVTNPTLGDFLMSVEPAERIECVAVQKMASAGLGVGVALDLRGNTGGANRG